MLIDPDDQSPRAVLARNLNKLMRATRGGRTDLSSAHKVEASAKNEISHGQVDRIQKADAAATVDKLAVLADAFGLAPWQLLLPDLEAWQDERGVLRVKANGWPFTRLERRRIDALGENLAGALEEALIAKVAELEAAAVGQPKPPVALRNLKAQLSGSAPKKARPGVVRAPRRGT